MTVHFSGLNLVKQLNENFSLNAQIDFSKLYLTFDSIYVVDFPSQILLFDFEKKKFNELKLAQVKHIKTVSTNTNYLYCLISNENDLSLIQISSSRIIKQVNLSDLEPILNNKPILVSTDINVYLFESLNGLKLKWSIDIENKNSKLVEQEKQLNESSVSLLPLNEVFIDEDIKEISAGKEHCLILTIKGKVYSFGLGTKGQLGHGKIENIYRPKLIQSFKDEIIKIACGGWHSAAIDSNHNAYFWGWNSSGQLGIKEMDSVFLTLPVKITIHDYISNEFVSFRQIRLFFRYFKAYHI